MFKKKKSDKDKESKKEEKRKREKDRKARAERTLSGREMADNYASSREHGETHGVVKREKHGLFHSLRKHERKSHDFNEAPHQEYPNGQTTTSGGEVEHSFNARLNVFENFASSNSSSPPPPKPSRSYTDREDYKGTSQSGNDNRSSEKPEDLQKVKTRAFELQRSSPVVTTVEENGPPKTERQISHEMKQKQGQIITVTGIQHDEIRPSKAASVKSESAERPEVVTERKRQPPKVAKKPSSPNKSYNSSLVIAPPNKGSVKSRNIPEALGPTERELDVKGISLALPDVKPAVEGLPRICSLRRQSNGGFGFALRRSTTSHNQDIYLAEPLGDASSTCLLPGDKLLEVNGHSIDKLSREKIVELVASSGNEVRLKVVPVPELAELTMRSGLDGGRVQVDETFLKSGSLARSGSMRMKKKTKTEAEVASEKEWLEAEKVWVVHKGGFSGGRMLKSSGDEKQTTCKVKLDQGGEILDIDEDSIEKANPPRYDRAEDLAALRHLNEPSCLHALRQRYGSSLIHTYAGQILIILNPVKTLNIYTDKVIQMFRGCKQEDMPPHIYASAQTTYRNMLATNSDQSLVLMGPSGAGKSVSCAHLLHYFSTTSVSSHSSLTGLKTEALLKLLDAFGNCSTRLNHNASRFTMLFTLDYDASGLLTSGSLQTFLLEKTRIVRKPEQESTFKVFNYFLAGCNKKLRQDFHLDVAQQDRNAFITYDQDQPNQQSYLERWNELQHNLEILGVSTSEMKCLWSLIAAIYHLGTAGVTMGNDNKPRFANPAGTQRAAAVLGVSVEEIAELIFAPPIVSQIMVRSPRGKKAGRLSSSSNEPSSPVDQPAGIGNQRLTQCFDALEGLAMGLYQQAFGILIFFINRSIQEADPRRIASINILDSAGFADTTMVSGNNGADFEDFCHNYQSERFQKFFHNIMFTQQLDRYSQENVDCTFDSVSGSPEKIVTLIDKAAQGGGVRMDLRNEKKGLLWLLDEESIFPGSTPETFLKRLCDQRQGDPMLKSGPTGSSFYLHHFQSRQPILYNARGWLKFAREHPTVKQANALLSLSSNDDLVTLSMRHADGLSRTRSFYRKTPNAPMSIKKDSQCLQLIYQVDNVLDCIRKTHISFIRCMLPVSGGGKYDLTNPASAAQAPVNASKMDVPLLRDQLKRAQILDAVRLHRQGYPEHMTFGEFQHRFSILAPPESRQPQPVLDEKKAAESLLDVLDVDSTSYRIGLSQIFLRAGTLAQLEDARDETITDKLIELQAFCRGYISRKKRDKLKVQQKAIRCIQRNVRQFITVREWEWWRLYTKIVPLLDVHRTEQELKSKTDEVDLLKNKVTKLENDNNILLENNARLEKKVSELSSILDDERASGHGTATVLQEEQVMRIRAEKEIESLKTQLDAAKKSEHEVRQEMIRAETITMTKASMEEAAPSGDQSEPSTNRKISTAERNEQMVNMSSEKNQLEKLLSDKDSENEELAREISNLKRKIARTSGEMADMKLLLEKSQSRNGELEKKQRRFDSDMARLKDDCHRERTLKEKITREKDMCVAERIQLENDVEEYREKLEDARNENFRLESDLSDLGKNRDGAKAVEMASSNRLLEKKIEDQEEELDEQAGQIQMLEQAKLKVEMELEQIRKRAQKEAARNEEDMEEMKSEYIRKIKQLEDQVEDEHQELNQAVRLRKESEQKLLEQRTAMSQIDQSSGKRYKQDLRSTKALLRDAQLAIDQLTQQRTKDKTQINNLKRQLDDQLLATETSLLNKKQLEIEVHEIQTRYDALILNKIQVDEKCSALARENIELKSSIEEDEEEMNILLQKNKNLVAEMSLLQNEKADLAEISRNLKREKESLQSEVFQLKHSLSYFEETSVEKNVHDKIGSKVKDLEQKLESALAKSHRLEVQNERLKETVNKVEEEKIALSEKESRFYQEKNKIDKKLTDTKEEFAVMEQNEAEEKKRRLEKESELEEMEVLLATTKSELAMTKNRLSDLQQAMEEHLNYDSDATTDSSSDDDDDDVGVVDHLSLTSSRAFSESGRMSSEPRSYKSYEDLDDVEDVSDRLARRLHALEELASPTSTGSSNELEKPMISEDGSTC